MASSRWKRFAFFERQALGLPSEVIEDLAPSGAAVGGPPADGGTTASSSSSSIRSLLPASAAAAAPLHAGDSFSLVVTTAAIPVPSSALAGSGDGGAVAAAATAGGAAAPSSSSSSFAPPPATTALEAMWCSLVACSAMDGEAVAAEAAPAAPSPRVPVVSLPSQAATGGAVGAGGGGASKSPGPAAPPAPADAWADGLVLAFASSQNTELVHCVDLTVRCNPPPAAGRSGSRAQPPGAPEDLDGWRGYFSPFLALPAPGDAGTSAPGTAPSGGGGGGSGREPPPRVVGLACCRTAAGGGRKLHVACVGPSCLAVWEDPHLHLSCRRPIASPGRPPADAVVFTPSATGGTGGAPAAAHALTDGRCRAVDIQPGMVAVGMDTGAVLIFVYNTEAKKSNHLLRMYLRIPPPPNDGVEVVSVKLASGADRASVFCSYRLPAGAVAPASAQAPSAGVCCYEIPLPGKNSSAVLSAPSARHDLDGRYVSSQALVDASNASAPEAGGSTAAAGRGGSITVARPDGLYSYSRTERTGVAPIDGTKLAFCLVPSPAAAPGDKSRNLATHPNSASSSPTGYLALVASTDAKSGRDAIDIYDSLNKLVAFHLLLSPGHRAVRAAALATAPALGGDGAVRAGRSSALVLTSGGSLITLTEKLTEEKISLLVQKNLYSAAIVVAYADPGTDVAVVTSLYRQYAEHLYRKGDYSGAIDQYCYTIGSLESSHVIFRYLDAPKIPLLVKYLEKLRSRGLATPVHNELLRTCYLKLNDTESADAIAASTSKSVNKASMASIVANLSSNPREALATICSLEAPQAAEILVIHGATLARTLPRETAGVVLALCLGTYSPKALAEAALLDPGAVKRMIERGTDDRPRIHEPYPFHLFSNSFLENPKVLRLILTHCNRNKCYLTASLRRTLLELTLAEWNQAKRTGDGEAEKMRHKEALLALTDSHSRDIGDYDALVIVQQAGFEEGELLLYERLQMTPLLLERYAKDGSEKARRQMLALCQSDAEVLADVLGHFVKIASEKLNDNIIQETSDEASEDDEAAAILDDIREALSLARRQGVIPPVRIARILAGEGTGQFSAENPQQRPKSQRTVPLSVALDYVGAILDESRKEITRLRSGVEEYNQLCNGMEAEIDSLLRASLILPPRPNDRDAVSGKLSIDDLYVKARADDLSVGLEGRPDQSVEKLESFWRDMAQSEDTFETIARYFAKASTSFSI